MLDESEVQEFNWTLTSCKIEWRIENFCLAIRTDRYVVLSPDFILRGYNNSFTKWRMNLIVNGEKCSSGVFSFVLERLHDYGPNIISLNWEVSLKTGEKIFEPVESDFSFSVNSKKDIYLQPVKEVLGYLPPFEDDTLVVHCFVIVGNNEESANRYESPDYGLKCLSEDLQCLKKHNINGLADVILRVGERDIHAHKAILCRNKVLESYIDKAQSDTIVLKNLDYEAVDKFVNFLYSGNSAEIFTKPSISMIKCITHFDNEILMHRYIPEELTIFTRINAETHEFHWSVSDILNETTNIASPPIRRLNVDTIWQLNISLRHDDCISLYADIIGGEHPLYFCLEFCVQDEKGEVFHPKRLIRVNQRYDNLGFTNFITKNDLNSSIYIDETIRILFKIRTSDGTQESSVGCRNLSFVSSTVKSSYEQLSHDLMELLKSKKYCNIIIKFNNKLYYAHRCILASRSIEFSKIISLMPPKNDVVPLDQVEEDSLESVLEYIYGGVLKDREVNKVIKIYDSALVLGIQSLIEECQVALRATGHNV